MKDKLNILVVDDKEVIRELFTKTLKTKGHNVVAVEDGYKAIEASKKQDFDLAFIDIVMPGINGVETFKKVKNGVEGPMVAMMTGYSVEEEIKKAQEMGALTCLRKPFDIVEIMNIVKKVCEEK